jgi:hypothetical protein
MHVSESDTKRKQRKNDFRTPGTTPSLTSFSCVHRQNYKTEDNEGSKDSEESIEAANFPVFRSTYVRETSSPSSPSV